MARAIIVNVIIARLLRDIELISIEINHRIASYIYTGQKM